MGFGTVAKQRLTVRKGKTPCDKLKTLDLFFRCVLAILKGGCPRG